MSRSETNSPSCWVGAAVGLGVDCSTEERCVGVGRAPLATGVLVARTTGVLVGAST